MARQYKIENIKICTPGCSKKDFQILFSDSESKSFRILTYVTVLLTPLLVYSQYSPKFGPKN